MNKLLQKHKVHFSDISSLYEYQEEVLECLSNWKDTLAIIPTGGGKSLIYQMFALELSGITIVIQPLLALMKEQVKELNEIRQIPALALNSSLSFIEQRETLRKLSSTNYKLIYMSPERLQNSFFRAALLASGVKISMIVIDEAHCISQWGSSFRPDYGQINKFKTFLQANNHTPITLCLTATLSKPARQDIASDRGTEYCPD
jgi:ATP-dependent DNA helicase RecQ